MIIDEDEFVYLYLVFPCDFLKPQMKRAVIIMAKVPIAGAVKTRLEPFLSPEKCAELAAAFLQDAEIKAKSICENTILAYTPGDRKNVLENTLRREHKFVEQTGATLGERMANAFEFAFARCSGAVVMIGTDSPSFPAEFVERAFELLEIDSDLVLGKAKDGGFYLIGGREIHSELFANVEWSSAAVFEQTKKNAERLKLRWREIPVWYDVDTPDDLLFLRDEMAGDEQARQCAPATFSWLKRNARLFKAETTITF